MWRERLERYRERLSDDRRFGTDEVRIDLERWLVRSEVSVRVYGRRVAHRTLRDREAEQLYDEAVLLLAEQRLTDACALVRG